MGDALDDLLDGIGLPSAQPQQDPLDDLLDSVGLPKKPAARPHRDMSQLGADLRAVGAEPGVGSSGVGSDRGHGPSGGDLLGAVVGSPAVIALHAAPIRLRRTAEAPAAEGVENPGASAGLPGLGYVKTPDSSYLDVLKAAAGSAFGVPIAALMEEGRDVQKRDAEELSRITGVPLPGLGADNGVPEGLTDAMAELSRDQRERYLEAHPDNLHAAAALGGELGVNILPMAVGAPAALRGGMELGKAPTLAKAVGGAVRGLRAGAAGGAALGYLGSYGAPLADRIDAATSNAALGGLVGIVGGAAARPELAVERGTPNEWGYRDYTASLGGQEIGSATVKPEPGGGFTLSHLSWPDLVSETTPPEVFGAAPAGHEAVLRSAAADLGQYRGTASPLGEAGEAALAGVREAAPEIFGPRALESNAIDLRAPEPLPAPQVGDLPGIRATLGRFKLTEPAIAPQVQAPAAHLIVEQTSYQGIRKAPLLGPNDEMLVAKGPNGQDAGFLWYTKEPGGGFSVRRIETAPEARGQGVARSLYQEAATREGPYRGSTAQTPDGEALVGRLRETNPQIFAEKPAAITPAAAVADRIGASTPPEHLATFVPSTDDAVASPSNGPAVHGAVAGDPLVVDMADPGGAHLEDGVRHWMLRSALGDAPLADRLLTSGDAGLRKIGASIASVAPSIQEGGELRGALARAAAAVADAREAGGPGPEMARVGALLGPDAPVEVHRLASFMVEHGDKPEELGLMLHRAVELQQGAGTQPGAAPPAMDALLQMAADQRQQAGATLPLESAVTIARRPMAEMPVRSTPGQAGFLSFQAPRWGTSSPIARWFTRDGYWRAMGSGMSRRTADLVRTKDNAVTAEAGRVTRLVRDFGSAFEDHMAVAPAGTPREDVLRYVRQGMEGNNDLSQVSAPLQDAAMAIRAHLDATSQRYVARPDLPPTLRSAIQSNVGTYLPRTFEAFTDPKGWEKKLRAPAALAHSQAHLIDDAAAWAKGQHPQWTDDQAKGYAWHLVLADPNAAYAVASPQRGAVGGESRANLIARKGLPAELDALLGLHADPAMSFQLSQMRAVRDLETYDLHSKLLAEGSQPGPKGEPPLFVGLHDELHPVQIGGKGPLAQMYTSPEIAASIRGTEAISPALTGWMRTYMKVNGAVKAGMTAGNFPMGVMRNLLTAPFQLLAQGHFIQAFPLKYAWETAQHVPLAIEANLGTKRGAVLKMFHGLVSSMDTAFGTKVGDRISTAMRDLRPEIEELTELGVFGQSTTTNDLRYYLGQQEGEPIPSRFGRGVRTIGAFWSGEHDLTKHASYSAERQNLRWANPAMTDAEVKQLAAQRVIATMPTRSEVSPALRAVRAAPLVAPFPTWAAEFWRNAKNNIGIAASDLRNPNPRMKVLGAKRAAGIAASWYLAAGGMSKMLQMLWGTSDQDADALREFAPPYHKNTELAVAERRGGQVRYFSASPLMPQSGISGAVLAMYRGIAAGHPRDGIIDGIEEALRPFTDTEFLAKAGLELHANRTQEGGVADWAMDLAREHPTMDEGRTIYERGAPLSTTAGQVGSYLWHNLAPGTPREVERLARASELTGLSNENSRGKRYTVPDELAAVGGLRFSTLDLNRGLTETGAGLKRAYDDSTKYFSIERGGSRNDPATVLAARDAANAKWKNALEQAKAKIDAARQLRISDAAIRANLLRVGVKPNVIGQLMSGNFRPLPLNHPYREPIDFVGRDEASSP